MGFPKGIIDHINGNPLDNRKKNLRVVNSKQNKYNCFKKKFRSGNNKCSSIYKGVCWVNSKRKWVSRCNDKYIGEFDSEKKAAIAYNKKALELHGEFARLNNVR